MRSGEDSNGLRPAEAVVITSPEIFRTLLAVGTALALLAILHLVGRDAIDRRVAWTLAHADRGPLLTWRLRRPKDGFIRSEASYAAFCVAGTVVLPVVGLLALVELASHRPSVVILGEVVAVHQIGLLLGWAWIARRLPEPVRRSKS